MQNLFNDFIKLIENEKEYFYNGDLFKNKIVEDALKIEPKLIKLLIKNKKIKETFFKKIEEIYVFDKIKFQKFISNKNFLPESYTFFKNKIGLTIEDNIISQNKHVTLSWPYKDCILQGTQDKEDIKKEEIFWNETLAPDEIDKLLKPKALTNFKLVDKEGIKKVNDIIDTDNLLIKGNNLLAVVSILKRYRNKVKMIYIDIPYYFNESKKDDAFKYNSNFKLSTWLTFHKNRIEYAKKLLKEDGVIFIHSNDESQAYLKVLCDEIFSINNYVNTISVNLKNIAGASGGGEDKRFKKNVEYIHIYAKNYNELKPFNSIYNNIKLEDLIEDYKKTGKSWKYTSVLYNEGTKKYLCSTVDGSGKEIKIFKRENYEILSINKIMKKEKISEMEVYNKYYNKIFNTVMPQSSIRVRVLEKLCSENLEKDLISIEYTPTSGKHKNSIYEQFYKGEKLRLFAWLEDVVVKEDNILYKKQLMGTYWDYTSYTNNLSKEGDVVLANGKKPEKLLKDIIECSTNPNDLILDMFLGSGTTCAVAMKMNRRFIGIEQLDYGENDSFVRLQNVIKGDTSGISKLVDWNGEGRFIYFELAKENQNIIDKIVNATSTNTLLKIIKNINEKTLLSIDLDFDKLKKNIETFALLELIEQKQLLIEILDKNLLYIPYSEIENNDYNFNQNEKELNRIFYKDNNNEK